MNAQQTPPRPALPPALLAFVDDLARLYAELWAAGRLDEIRKDDVDDDG